jgi:hypothetical protein
MVDAIIEAVGGKAGRLQPDADAGFVSPSHCDQEQCGGK